MAIPGARRFQTGGPNFGPLNPGAPGSTPAAPRPGAPGGVNPLPPVAPGGPAISPFQAGAPAAGLGAAAPGLNPAAIQQAVAARRMQSGMGLPGGMPGGPPPSAATAPINNPGLAALGGIPPGAPPAGGANPMIQQLAARGVMPGGASLGPLMPPAPGAAGGLAGAAPMGGAAGPANPLLGAAPQMAGLGMAKGGRVRKFNSTKAAAEDLPTHPGAAKKAKGGVIKRKPLKPPIAAKAKRPAIPPPPPPGGGMQVPPPDNTPDMSGDGGPAAGPGLPSGAIPGMKRGGKWIKGAIKKPGALHKQLGVPQGEKIPAKKLAKAADAGGKLGQRARLAETLKGLKHAKGGKCDKMAAGGAAKQRKGFPNTQAPSKRFATGGKVRGCGVATKGCGFAGIF